MKSCAAERPFAGKGVCTNSCGRGEFAAKRGQVLMDADSSLNDVFFPEIGVISVVAVYADGSVIEMATIGREGCTGVQAIFGAKSSSVRLLVQIPGSAAKMPRAAFTRAMESMPSFRKLMFAYVHAFLEQVLVSVACNGGITLTLKPCCLIFVYELA
jgi:CRP-like cAMP-binding protein